MDAARQHLLLLLGLERSHDLLARGTFAALDAKHQYALASAAPIVMRGIGQHIHLVLRGGSFGDIHLQARQVLARDRLAHRDVLAVQHQAAHCRRPFDADGNGTAIDIDRFRQAEIDRADPRQHDLLQHWRQRWPVAAAHQHHVVDQRGIFPGHLHAVGGFNDIAAHRRHDRADLLVRRQRATRECR